MMITVFGDLQKYLLVGSFTDLSMVMDINNFYFGPSAVVGGGVVVVLVVVVVDGGAEGTSYMCEVCMSG